jgi:hypothetical protein
MGNSGQAGLHNPEKTPTTQARYRLYRRSNRSHGTYYAQDCTTGARESLGTKSKGEAKKLLQAKHAKAQADYDLVNARSNWEVVRLNLIEIIGAEPQCGLQVAPYDFSRLDSRLVAPLDQFVQTALKQKPDLLVKVARTALAQTMATQAQSDNAIAASLASLTYASGQL